MCKYRRLLHLKIGKFGVAVEKYSSTQGNIILTPFKIIVNRVGYFSVSINNFYVYNAFVAQLNIDTANIDIANTLDI